MEEKKGRVTIRKAREKSSENVIHTLC